MSNTVPQTFEEAVYEVLFELKQADNLQEQDLDPALYHHGYGTALRNEWGLWGDSALARNMKKRFGLGHADDMSGLIMETAFATFKGETFDIDSEVERYKNHWNTMGIDPLTQEQLN